jgi:hypothetical protein
MIQIFLANVRQVYDFFKVFAKKFGHKKDLDRRPYLRFWYEKKPRIAWFFQTETALNQPPSMDPATILPA